MTVGPFTQDVLDSHAAWLLQDVNGQLRTYLTALASMFEIAADIVRDQGFPDDPDYVPGWSTLLDPVACPTQFLPYLGLFVGVQIPIGTPDAAARALIVGAAATNVNGICSGGAHGRGTFASVQAAALSTLVAQAPNTVPFLKVLERTAANGQSADPYHAVIQFRANECPDVAALVSAVEATKPAGIQITYVSTTGYTWNTALNKWSQDTMTWTQSSTIQT